MRASCTGILCLLLSACAAVAQPVTSLHELEPLPVLQRPTAELIRPGIVGGVIGVVLGSLAVGVPLALAMELTDDGLSTPGILLGWQAGQAAGIALGVHLGNQRQGSLTQALVLSAAVATVGTALLWTDDFDALFESRRHQIIMVSVPLAQLVASIHASRR